MIARLAILVLALAACSKSTSSSGSGSATAKPAVPRLGDPCGADGACPPGLTCVGWGGFGTPKENACEIKCDPKAATSTCPAGTHCVTIYDGPGQVCRVDGPKTAP